MTRVRDKVPNRKSAGPFAQRKSWRECEFSYSYDAQMAIPVDLRIAAGRPFRRALPPPSCRQGEVQVSRPNQKRRVWIPAARSQPCQDRSGRRHHLRKQQRFSFRLYSSKCLGASMVVGQSEPSVRCLAATDVSSCLCWPRQSWAAALLRDGERAFGQLVYGSSDSSKLCHRPNSKLECFGPDRCWPGGLLEAGSKE